MGRPISVEDAQIAAIALTANLTLATRRPYVKIHQKKWNGVNLVDLYAPTSKNLEAIVHTFLAVLKAHQCNADILSRADISLRFPGLSRRSD